MTEENVNFARPIDLTDNQVKDLITGNSIEVGEHYRPRALTDEHVEALRGGQEINLENIPMIARHAGSVGHIGTASITKPSDLTDKDIGALSTGKDIEYKK